MRAESVLPTAARIAKFVKGELLLVHSIEEPISSEILQDGADLQVARDLAGRLEAASTRYLDRLKSQVTREGISVQTLVVRHSNEHESVLAIAQADRTDLVVLSANGSASDSRRTFGSVTVCLLAHSTVPLLVLQDLPEHAPEHVPVMDGKQAPPMRATYSLEST
jgi:nucleotide-binding universal stress UspA family protein